MNTETILCAPEDWAQIHLQMARNLVGTSDGVLHEILAKRYFLCAEVMKEQQRLIESYRSALNLIAAWDEGEKVDSSFDEPSSAGIAREALVS